MSNEDALERARNNQLNDYLDSQEDKEPLDIEETEAKIIKKWLLMAKEDSFEDSLDYIAGAFYKEGLDNFLKAISDSLYFKDLIRVKAQNIAEGLESDETY
jgi:hypothetical protein